ncbi:MAG TPA: universal stress protein [Vicinamibacterales bacterium]|nr:universal stress protein [Vicinamibacterales bacterium]
MKPAKRTANRGPSSRRRRSAKTSGRGGAASTINLLVIVDATDASRGAVQYSGRIAARVAAIECHLACIVPRLPPELLESGGSELPRREEQIESDLWLEQQRWTATIEKEANRTLRAARATLERAGVASGRIHTRVWSPSDASTAVDDVLLLARDAGCQTVVVGHQAHPWFRGLGAGHLAEQLVRTAKGLAVWVIG